MTTEQFREITKKMWDAAKLSGVIPRDSMGRVTKPWRDYLMMKGLLNRLIAKWEETEDANYGWFSTQTRFNGNQTLHVAELRQNFYSVRFIYQVCHENLATAMWLAVAAKLDLLTINIVQDLDIKYHREINVDAKVWKRTHTCTWEELLIETKRMKQSPQKETLQFTSVIPHLIELETNVLELTNQLHKLKLEGLAIRQKLYDLRMKLANWDKENAT